jgi:tetratricopeptide (TPR) repeat protein
MAKPEPKIDNPLPEYQAAVNADPNSVEAETNLGWGYYGQGQYDEAVKAFEKALASSGDHFDAQYGIALTYKKAGRSNDAAAAFKKALGLTDTITDFGRSQIMAKIIRSHLADLHAL